MFRFYLLVQLSLGAVLTLGCPEPTETTPSADSTTDLLGSGVPDINAADTPPSDVPVLVPIEVHVTLDGEPAVSSSVSQGGNPERWQTNAEGIANVMVDLRVPGERVLIASHPDARIRGKLLSPDHVGPFELNLTRFSAIDNPNYRFKDPGEPGMSHLIEKCGHCHLTMDETWFESAHKTSASNPILQDVYQGTASGFGDKDACNLAGGLWQTIVQPGTGQEVMGCVVGQAVSETGQFGACADCHAPGIDGKLGGRDLLEARDHAFNYGVHCDVCHHTESVDMNAPPGVAGRLKIVRPSEPASIPGLGEFQPLTFCPNDDVPNIYMGCVERSHFRSSEFCGGCHEQKQNALFPDAVIDKSRWPDEKIPVHTTYSEWKASSFAASLTCQACHMPPAPDEIVNGADLQAFNAASTGITGGWPRPPGSTKLHTWSGPRSPQADQLSVPLSLEIVKTIESNTLTAQVTVTNAAAGHSVPTGEPLRSVLVLVSAACGDKELVATGGDAVPDYGGAISLKQANDDWSTWEKAEVGDTIRVIKRGEPVDYQGYGPFGDGTFSIEERGLVQELVVGSSTIEGISDNVIALDNPLPEGDVAYLVRGNNAHAGTAGTGFARVLVDQEGTRMIPHFRAIDVVSDNRLLSQQSWTSNHLFKATCPKPTVTVQVIQRAYPLRLALERGWPMRDKLWMTETN